jgi:hypothetical protein
MRWKCVIEVFAVASIMFIYSNAQASGIGRVIHTEGEVLLKHLDGSISRDVGYGHVINQHDSIVTGDNAMVKVMFADGSLMTIGERTSIVFDEYLYEPEVKRRSGALRMLKGWLRFLITKLLSEGSSLGIFTPSGNIGVRGTLFMVWVSEDGSQTKVFCIEGEVSVWGLRQDEGSAKIIGSMRKTTVMKGRPPSEPSTISEDEARMIDTHTLTWELPPFVDERFREFLPGSQKPMVYLLERISKEKLIPELKIIAPSMEDIVSRDRFIFAGIVGIPPIEQEPQSTRVRVEFEFPEGL